MDNISAKRVSCITHPRKSAVRSASSVCVGCFPTRKSFGTKVSIISVWLTVKHSLAHAAHAPHRRCPPAQSHLPSRRLYTLQVSTRPKIHFQCILSEFFSYSYSICCAIFVIESAECFICDNNVLSVISFTNFNLGLVTGNLRSNSYCVIIFRRSAFNECILQYLVSV